MQKSSKNYWVYIGIVSLIFFNIILGIKILTQTKAETLLYVQNAQSASLIKKENSTYTLTMQNAPETLFFSDRPYRRTGNVPSSQFVNMLNKESKDPPNSILQVHLNGTIRNIPLELLKGTSDTQNLTIEYTVKPLSIDKNQDYLDVTALGEQTDFTGAVLFIDAFPTSVNDQITD